MSLQQAELFIGRMKTDKAFSECILGTEDVEERIAIARREGFDCSSEDIEQLQSMLIEPHAQNSNLPLSWQCKGPCHTKCSDVVA